jgi:hypothetical protein
VLTRLTRIRLIALGAAAMIALPGLTSSSAQRRDDWDWDGNYRNLGRINRGTFLTVQTTRPIDSTRPGGRIYPGVVADDVWDDYGRLSGPAIPRGSRVDLVVRAARDGDLILDLDAIYAHGYRYSVSAIPERIEGERPSHEGEDAAAWIGGGAIIGTIIGSIAGGATGAAIGAATGAAAGLGLTLQGRSIRVPAGSLITFHVNEGLELGRPRGPGNWRPY